MKVTVALCVLVSAAAVCARLTHTDDKAEAIKLLKILLAEYDRKEAANDDENKVENDVDLETPALDADGEHVGTQRDGQQGNEQKEDRYVFVGPGGVQGWGPGVVVRPPSPAPSRPPGNRPPGPMSVSGVGPGLVGNRPPGPISVSGVGPGLVANRPQPYGIVGPPVGVYMRPNGQIGYSSGQVGYGRSGRDNDQENEEKATDNEANLMEDKSFSSETDRKDSHRSRSRLRRP